MEYINLVAAAGWSSAFLAAYQWYAWRKLAIVASEGFLQAVMQQEEADKAMREAISQVQILAEEVNEHVH